MTFAFQFLLTNFTFAAGISSRDNLLDANSDDSSDNSWGYEIRKIESKVGAWSLLIVNLAIFIACFLAVKLTLINSLALGTIVGIVIWSAYFLLLLWVSSSTVGSLVGSVINIASSGTQGVMATAGAALAGRTANAQIVNTVEASVAAVRRELNSAVDPTRVRETVQDYLADLPIPKLDLKQIRNDFANLLTSSGLRSLADSDVLQNVNRQTFIDLISSRTDLSKQDVNRLADQLESAWQQVIDAQQTNSQSQLLNILQSASPETLTSNQLSDKLGQLVGVGADKSEGSNGSDGGNDNGLTRQAVELGVSALLGRVLWVSALLGRVLSRTDLSDVDVQKISRQLQQFQDKATAQAKSLSSKVADRLPGQSFNTIQADVDNYLLNSKSWHLNRETLKQEFRDVIYDPEAAPKAVSQQLEQLNRSSFVKVLESRGIFTSERIADIADQLEEVRKEVFDTVQTAESEEQSQDLRSRIENYLRSTGKEELNPDGIKQNFKALLNDPEASIEVLSHRLSQFDRDTLVQLLNQRQDLSEEQINQIIDQFLDVQYNILNAPQQLADNAKEQYDRVTSQSAEYLHNTNLDELNPEGIQQDLAKLLDDPKQGALALRERLSQIDRETLVKLLSQREDLSEEQVNQIIDQVQNAIQGIVKAPRRLASRAKEQIQDFQTNFTEYLQNTNKEELNSEGIKRDLQQLLNNPQEGWKSISDRFSQIDRDTLVSLLSQRQDISEEEANQIADNIESVRNQFVEQAQAVQRRMQSVIDSSFGKIRNYLNSLDRPELNYERIKRDFRKVFDDPEAGFEALRDRLGQFDRETLVAVLSSVKISQRQMPTELSTKLKGCGIMCCIVLNASKKKLTSASKNSSTKLRSNWQKPEKPQQLLLGGYLVQLLHL